MAMDSCKNRIKFYRESMNITQQELADRLGTSVRNIRRWENQESSPDVLTAIKLSQILGQNIEDIFVVE